MRNLIWAEESRREYAESLSSEYQALAQSWQGKTPIMVAKAILYEYRARFEDRQIEHIENTLRLHGNSWKQLINNINICIGHSHFENNIKCFFTQIITVVRIISKNIKTKERREHRQRQLLGDDYFRSLMWGHYTCKLCWRTTELSLIKYFTTCHIHSGSCRSQDYIRRTYLLKKCRLDFDGKNFNVFSLAEHISRKTRSLCKEYLNGQIKSDSNSDVNHYEVTVGHNLYRFGLISIQQLLEYFPLTKEYLSKRTNMAHFHNVIEALESPPIEEPRYISEARMKYYELLQTNVPEAIVYFARVEAWLMMEAAHPWGGPREGAGRKAAKS